MKKRGLQFAIILFMALPGAALASAVDISGNWFGEYPPDEITFSDLPVDWMNGTYYVFDYYAGSSPVYVRSDVYRADDYVNTVIYGFGGGSSTIYFERFSPNGWESNAWAGIYDLTLIEGYNDFGAETFSFSDVLWSATFEGGSAGSGGFGPGYSAPGSGNILTELGSALVPHVAAALGLVAAIVAVRVGLRWTKGLSSRAT